MSERIVRRIKVVRTTVDRVALQKEVGRHIRAVRGKRTQIAVAEAAGLARTSLINIEQGRQGTPIHRLYDIAYALGVPVRRLLP